MSKELPSPELLRKLLRYEPETGKLFWRERGVEMFSDGKQSAEWACNRWNSRYSGKEAFTAIDTYGYKKGSIFKTSYLAHRVIWAMVNGEWAEEIDHIHGVRCDNRMSELRAVSHKENARNQRKPSNNTSGAIGVCWHKSRERWVANVKINGKVKFLGYFTDFDEAVTIRKDAEAKYKFHENHGRAG